MFCNSKISLDSIKEEIKLKCVREKTFLIFIDINIINKQIEIKVNISPINVLNFSFCLKVIRG
jgi:hypothetical protein